jgi:hypothetical protein
VPVRVISFSTAVSSELPAGRNVEFAQHVAVFGDSVAPFVTPPDTGIRQRPDPSRFVMTS